MTAAVLSASGMLWIGLLPAGSVGLDADAVVAAVGVDCCAAGVCDPPEEPAPAADALQWLRGTLVVVILKPVDMGEAFILSLVADGDGWWWSLAPFDMRDCVCNMMMLSRICFASKRRVLTSV